MKHQQHMSRDRRAHALAGGAPPPLTIMLANAKAPGSHTIDQLQATRPRHALQFTARACKRQNVMSRRSMGLRMRAADGHGESNGELDPYLRPSPGRGLLGAALPVPACSGCSRLTRVLNAD